MPMALNVGETSTSPSTNTVMPDTSKMAVPYCSIVYLGEEWMSMGWQVGEWLWRVIVAVVVVTV
jgi:hypothetical protein